MRLYLSGPMTGYPDLNYAEFHRVAAKLRAEGHEVWSPAECKENEGQEWHVCMKRDFHAVLEAEAVAVMDCWEFSRGARCEVFVGLVCHHPIFNANTMQEIYPTAIMDVIAEGGIPQQLKDIGAGWILQGRNVRI